MSIQNKTQRSGQFSKGTSGNPYGRPPGSRNRATVLIESLLQGEAEQLTRKAIEMALGGDITAMRLCLERIYPPRKDRPIQLNLPAIENIQEITAAMATVLTAISDGEITPTEGEILSNILAAHKAVLVTGDLERRMDNLEQRISLKSNGAPTAPCGSGVQSNHSSTNVTTKTNLANRLQRLEQRVGPDPVPISHVVNVRAWMIAFRMDELAPFEERWAASEASGAPSLLDIFAEGTAEREDILRRLEPALDAVSLEMTGHSYAELLRQEALGQQ